MKSMNIKLLTEKKIKELGLQKTVGVSKSDTPIIKTIRHRGEYLNLIYIPSIGWIQIPSYRSISKALKIGKSELNRLQKGNKMNENQELTEQNYIQLIEALSEKIKNLHSFEILDNLYKLIETDIEIENKNELIELHVSEAQNRDIFTEDYFNLWLDNTLLDTTGLEPFTEDQEPQEPTEFNESAFSELYSIGLKSIEEMNTSGYKKEKLKNELKEEFMDLDFFNFDLNIDPLDLTETQLKESTENDPEKEMLINAIKSINPPDISLETLDLKTIQEIKDLIKNSSDELLQNKITNYLKAVQVTENKKRILKNQEKKEKINENLENFDLDLDLENILFIESKIKSENQENEKINENLAYDYIYLMEKIEELTNKNLKNELLKEALNEEPTEFARDVIQILIQEKKEELKENITDNEIINLLKKGNIIVNSKNDEVLWFNGNFMLDEEKITEEQVQNIFKEWKKTGFEILKGE